MKFRSISVVFIGLAVSTILFAQSPANPSASQAGPARAVRSAGGGIAQGSVKDSTGGVIPGAMVSLTSQNGTVQTTAADAQGNYRFRNVAPGDYTVSASYTGLQQKGVNAVTVTAGAAASANLVMTVQEQRQELTVSDTSNNTVSTEAANNQTALVLKQEDLDALPDDPDDLQADLQALAGPAAGPGGNQIFIDGFTGGRLPPKETIREIRINSNPFSAEFDKLGYGRIQIFTKPGSDKFHGQGYYNISDGIWDSRNPFLSVNPPFRTQLFGGNVSGPLGKHASFFVDAERRNIDDNGIITATIPTDDFLGHYSYQNFFPTPQRRTTFSPRVDYQLGANNTLSFRYEFLENDRIVTGIGSFDLPETTIGNITFPSSGYSSSITENTLSVIETAVLGAKAVNETHFQFDRESTTYASQSQAPALYVSQSFVSGGSGYSAPGFSHSYDVQDGYELQNYTTLTWGAHTTKMGLRIRATALDDSSPKGFNGEYEFLGTARMQSIEQYLGTIQRLEEGFTPAQVTKMGYGPSKYTVTTGNPNLSFYQMDFGPFVQDDWRVRPNLTLSIGLRWESQTNIPDHSDWAPRFSFAWSPDAHGANGRAKTVIRGGWGYFYDRFAITNVETAYRYNESNQLLYTLNRPTIYDTAFDTAIPIEDLTSAAVNVSQKYQIDSTLKAPRLMQTSLSVERQLLAHTTVTATFVNSRGTHELRTVDINAPYPIPGQLPPGATQNLANSNANDVCCRPFGDVGDIYNMESDGIFKQTQVIIGVNSQVGKWLTLFGRYSHNDAHSDTDGVSTLPADPYDFSADWGRSALDISDNLFFGGSIAARWGLRFSPFLVMHSGIPYNITTGTDLFLQGQGAPTARPTVVDLETPYLTPFGYLNPLPLVPTPGEPYFIERNAATGPGFVGLNLRVSKTWGFGTTKFSGPSGGARAGGGGYGGHGGGGFGGGGFHGGGGESTEHRYNLTLSVNARNILNHPNFNTPNGALTSPYFMESTNITGGYAAESTASNTRRIDLQLRFTF
ncbi:MAG: TonB-dependent receptor [Acidobacteriaceae bacterium]|nr:TonB-dependent receptor [Acidobacteriaceae bacterium]MBV9502595.1 TonB-dependent receptor [Acidobacteriaceae bacterium]